ncbi:MAG TPA: hypothetical protein VGD58_15700 [Herpetosiphonaceae bacterium]
MRGPGTYLLLLLEAMLVFALGVFGNKVAEILNVTSGFILLSTIILFVLAFLINIVLVKSQNQQQAVISQPLAQSLEKWIPSRVATIFPFAIFVGIVVCFFFFIISNDREFTIFFWYFLDYEAYSFLLTLILLYIFSRYKADRTVILTYAIGFAFGIGSCILLLIPNLVIAERWFNFTSWIIIELIAALIVNSHAVQGLANDFRGVIQNLTRTR